MRNILINNVLKEDDDIKEEIRNLINFDNLINVISSSKILVYL